MTEFPIYALGDVGIYFHVFNSIASILQSDFVTVLGAIVTTILFIRIGLSFSKADVRSGAIGTAVAISMTAMALAPTTTAHIIDIRKNINQPAYTKIDNLPFALVFVAYSISSITADIIDLFDTAFSVVDDGAKATSIGVGVHPELLKKLIEMSNFDKQEVDYKMKYFKKAFKLYVKDCALREASLPPIGKDYLTNPFKDLLETMDPVEIELTSMDTTSASFSDGLVTLDKCVDIYQYMLDNRDSVEERLIKSFENANSYIDFTGASREQLYASLYRYVQTPSSEDIEATGAYSKGIRISMINYAMAKSLNETIDDYGYEIAKYSIEKNMYSMMLDGVASVAWVNKVANLVIHYSLVFSYALFLLVIPFAMGMGAENSLKLIGNYFMGIFSIHLGYVAAVVANNIYLYYAQTNAIDIINQVGNNMTAMAAIPYVTQYAGEMAAVSGILLAMSYTVGAMIIMKGQTAAMSGAMNTIMSRYRNEMLNAADDFASKQSWDQVEDAEKRKAQLFLEQNNFAPKPAGMSEIEYAKSLQAGLDQSSSGYGFYQARQMGGSEFDRNYMSGVAARTTMSSASTMEYGNKVDADIAYSAGRVDGLTRAGESASSDDILKSKGADAIFESARFNNLMRQLNAMGSGFGNKEALSEYGDDQIINTARVGTLAQIKDQVANAQNLTNKFGSNLDDTGEYKTSNGTKSMTYDQMAKAESEMKLAGRMGSAGGYGSLGNKAFDMTAENADYGVQSKTLATQARIGELGGLNKAVTFDELSSKVKTASELSSLDGQLKGAGAKDGVQAAAEEIAKAVSKIASTAGTMAEGKMVGDMSRIDYLNKNHKGGYVGFQKDSAEIQSMQGAGQIGGLKDIMNNPEKIKDFVAKAQEEAAKIGKLNDLNKDLERAGLLQNGQINPENWVQAKSFLQANNMNSHNAMIAGGMVISGAIGDDSTVKVDALNSTQSGNKEDNHINNKTIHTGADYRSALQTFVANGGSENDTEGLIKFIQNSQLTDAHKKNLLGHIAASVAEQTGLEQHDAESLVGAVGAGVGAVGLNAMLGNPIGKTVDGLKSATDKLRGIDNETFDNTPNSGNSINSSNADNGTINQTNSSNNREHTNSLSKYTNSSAHNASIAQDALEVNNMHSRQAFNGMLNKIGKALPFIGGAIGAYEVGSGYANNGVVGAAEAGLDILTMGMYGASMESRALQKQALNGRVMGGGHQNIFDGFMAGVDRTFGTSFGSTQTLMSPVASVAMQPQIDPVSNMASSAIAQVQAMHTQQSQVLDNPFLNTMGHTRIEQAHFAKEQQVANNELIDQQTQQTKQQQELLKYFTKDEIK